MTKELNDKNKDFAIIEHYTEEIYNLKKIIDEYERQKKDEKLFDKLQQDKSSYLSKLNEKKEQLNEIESSIINIDATLIDLNDKKDFVNEIKSALSVEILVQFVVMKYIHWENILILNQLLKNNKK